MESRVVEVFTVEKEEILESAILETIKRQKCHQFM